MSAPYPVRHVPHAVIATRDGLRLSAALFLPDAPGDGPFPAALDAVPYRKDDDFRATDWDTYAALAALGVACVRLDLRGTGSSEGVLADEYTAAEHDDCEDAIAWIAAQPWCNGRVGMTGVSWGGFNAVQVAMRRPAALGAIAPIHWSADRYGCDVHMVGGTLQALELVEWPGGMVVENALPPRRAHVGDEAFERLWRQRLDETPQWPLGWLGRQRRDAYWRHGSLCEDWGAIEVPVLAIGGWLDGYRDACLDLLAHGAMPRRAVIGPWAHARPHRGWPGPALDHRVLLARFFRHHLAGEANGEDAEPMLLAYVQDGIPGEPFPAGDVPGRWRAWRTWPPAAAPVELHLDGAALVAEAPAAPPAVRAWSGPGASARAAPLVPGRRAGRLRRGHAAG